MSGKNLYLTIGPGLQRLLRPGKVCIESGECGWLVIRKRRNQYYVYLQVGKRDIYLGSLAGFQPVPITLLLMLEDGKLAVDVDPVPTSPGMLVGAAKSLAVIAASLGEVEKLLNQILTKYKLSR